MRMMTVGGVLAAGVLLSACATITRGTSQKFSIESVPSEADVRLSTGQTCVTPCTLTLKRKSRFVVSVSKEGYRTEEREVHGKLKGGGAAGVAGNAIFGGVIGAGVDVASGAALSLEPNPLIVTLVPIDEAAGADAAPTAETAPVEASAAPVETGSPESLSIDPTASDESEPADEAAPAPSDDETAATEADLLVPSL